VWVLRHAKATSQGPDDHGRVLTARGRRQAAAVGSGLARNPVPTAPTPRLVLSSSARRAVQTAELVVAELEPGVELVVERALYGADPDDVIDILRGLDDDDSSVMVVGHNPTMHELALGLLDGEDTEAATVLEPGFPTAALAVLGVADDAWATVTLGSATLVALRTVDH
jgi:phosphohistidine phosphatase